MNFGRMVTVVRSLLGETSSTNSYWDDDADIKPMINDSQVAIASETEGMLTFCDYLTPAGGGGDGRLGLKADYLKLRAVHLFQSDNNKYVLKHLSMDEFEAYSWRNPENQSRPQVYKLEVGAVSITDPLPGDVWLYPIPDGGGQFGGANDQYKVRLYYYQKPTTLTDVSLHTSELPEHAHWAVCYHAAMHLAMMADNRSKYTDLTALYERAIAKLRIYYNSPQRDASVRMKDTMNYTRRRGVIRGRLHKGHR